MPCGKRGPRGCCVRQVTEMSVAIVPVGSSSAGSVLRTGAPTGIDTAQAAAPPGSLENATDAEQVLIAGLDTSNAGIAAAASVDDELAMLQGLSRARDTILMLEGLLKCLTSKEPMRAAFVRREAPMPDERGAAQLTPQDPTWSAAVLD